jgi:16S rRNA (cytosine967-C5)-methyltransferase
MAAQPFTARKTAWLVLNQCDITRHDTGEQLNEYLPNTDRPAQATDIVFGVIRNRLAIDNVIKHCGSVEPARVKPGLWNLLRIGTYELVYASKTAEYAILNEVCDLAGAKGTTRTVGFINAVLRAVQKKILTRQAPLAGADPQTVLPQDNQTGCVFTEKMLPNLHNDPVNYYSLAFSLPTWLISRWIEVYGSEKTRQICEACNRHPSVVAQPNTCCTTTEKLAEQLAAAGIEWDMDAEKKMLCIRHTGQITKIQAFLDGFFTIQDPTAAEAMVLLNPQPGWTLVDLCAAPGGKSIALAMLMQDTGTILASDSDSDRLQKVRRNIERMRLNAIEIVKPKELDRAVQKLKSLNAVILDVPCSNTGVLARRVEARWRLQKNSLDTLLKTQQQLLTKAAAWCRPKTHIVYSTCSIEPAENQQQIQQFLKQHSSFALLNEKLTLPTLKTPISFDRDGGYVAVLRQK